MLGIKISYNIVYLSKLNAVEKLVFDTWSLKGFLCQVHDPSELDLDSINYNNIPTKYEEGSV